MIKRIVDSRRSTRTEPVRIPFRPGVHFRVLRFVIHVGVAASCAYPCLAQPVGDSASLARQATALVLVEAGTRLISGTAVCVDSSGVFVTNAHTVAEVRRGATVNLVLRSGEQNQQVVTAQLLTIEDALDMAILKAKAASGTKPVAMVADSELNVQERVVRFRFSGASDQGNGYPKVSTKAEVIVAMPKDSDGRQQVQLEAPLGMKATEGAFCNEHGKLVGIAVRRQGPNQGLILSASRIADYLPGRVIIDFDPLQVDLGELETPRPWTIKLRQSGSGSLPGDLTVSLTLSAGAGDRRTYGAEPGGPGQYRATVIPLPPGADSRLALIASDRWGETTALVQNTTVRVGGTPVKLGELGYVENGYDVRLMRQFGDSRGGQALTRNVLVVTELVNVPPIGLFTPLGFGFGNLYIVHEKRTLHFSLYDAHGRMVMSADERQEQLAAQAAPLARLRRQLDSLWPPHELTRSEKDRLFELVLPICGQSLRYRPTARAIKTDGTVLIGWTTGLESVRFQSTENSRFPFLPFAQVSSTMVRPASVISPISVIQVAIEVQRQGKIVARMDKRLTVKAGSHLAGGDGVQRRIGTLPQPSAENEALLDVQGWLDLKDPRTLGAGRSVRSNSGEIGNAQVSVRATRAANLGLGLQRGAVWYAAFSPDGRQIRTASHDGSMILWDAQNGAMLKNVRLHDNKVIATSGERYRRRTALLSDDGGVRVWQLPGGREFRRSDGPDGAVHDLKFLGDGRHAVSGDADGIVRVWDVVNGRELSRLDSHSGAVHAVEVTPDDRTVLAGYRDGTIRLWDLDTARVLKTLKGHTGEVEGVAVSPHGGIAASCGGSNDNGIIVWDLATGRELRRLTGHTKTVLSVAFSPDGQRIVSGSQDGTARVWELVDADISTQAAGEPVVLDLGGTICDIVPGEGGRYLVLGLENPHRVAVFDVNKACITRVITLPEEDVFITAGASTFLLGFANRHILEEWDLATVIRISSRPLPIQGRLRGMAMGFDSDAPLLAVWVPPVQPDGGDLRAFFCFIDTKTGKVLRVRSHRYQEFHGNIHLELPAPSACLSIPWQGGIEGLTTRLRAHADGRRVVLQASGRGVIASGLAILDFEGDRVRSYRQTTNSMAVLSSDGQQVLDNFYTYQSRAGEKLLEATQEVPVGPREIWIPTLDPKYQLSVRPDPESVGSRASARQPNVDSGVVKELVIRNQIGTLATVSGLDEMRYPTRDFIIRPVDPLFDRRFLFIPAAKLLITIPPDQGRLVLRRLDLEGLLERPLRILRGEKPRESKKLGSSPSNMLPRTGAFGTEDWKSRGLLTLVPSRNALLIALTLLCYLAALGLCLSDRGETGKRRAKEQTRAHRLFLAVTAATAVGLTLTCLAVELLAYRNAASVNHLLEERMADPARPALTLRELQSLIGVPSDSPREENGRMVATYSWKGILRTHTLHVECAKGPSNDLLVLSFGFD